jgi:hypothetical protein
MTSERSSTDRRRTARRLPACCALLTLCLVAACSHGRIQPPVDHRQLLAGAQLRYQQARAPYKASGRMSVSGQDYSHSFGFQLRWESPGRARLDLTGPLGLTLASAVAADTAAWLSVPWYGYYSRGTLASLDSNATAALGLSLDTFFKFVEGWPPLDLDRDCSTREKKGLVEYLYQYSDTTIAVSLDRRSGDLVSLSVRTGARALLEIAYGDFRAFGPGRRPYDISIGSPASRTKLTIGFYSMKPAQGFPPETWAPPENKVSH